MKASVFASVLLVTLAVAAPRAVADQDHIGPLSITFGAPIDLFFPNIVHPFPSVKVLQFTGDATNNGSSVADLAIHFDYLDPAGNLIVVPLPNFYHNALPPGAITTINAGPTTLPYCPPQVSIHFELLTPGEVVFQGIYDHTCIPIPEPSAAAMLSIAGIAGFAGRAVRPGRRRRA